MTDANVFTPGKENLSSLHHVSNDDKSDSTHQIKLCPISNEESISPRKHDILDFKEEGYLLKNLITEQECNHYINEGERIGFEDVYEAKSPLRNSQRIMVHSQELADLLWTRLSAFLEDVTIDGDPHKVHIHGPKPLLQGTWTPSGLNPLFRLCRYKPGGHFAPHFDGHFAVSMKERSLKTFMLYLNSSFEDGTTNFVDESQKLYQDEEGKYCAEAKNILYRVRPESGMAIVFNHHRLHEGEAVRNGTKYILRTDIMYTKKDESTSDPKMEKAYLLVQEAERLEGAGENTKAMELYRRAFKMSPAIEEAFG